MEQRRGQAISMGDVAKAVGISRQAVYLHFGSRAELMVATSNYVDEVKGLARRLEQLQSASTGIELLETCVEVWGNYIPEIYGLAKALLATRYTDEATAAAWDANMRCLRDVCRDIVDALERERMLSSEWSREPAIEMLWTMLSIGNWEQLTVECGWSTAQYVDGMKRLLRRTFVQ
jgi:AcrR family transcriptional regulator